MKPSFITTPTNNIKATTSSAVQPLSETSGQAPVQVLAQTWAVPGSFIPGKVGDFL